ncbi:serine/threonine phosphatase [Romeria aff. gracilis LEGE 07310]|uniref:Serine/threonine phosphatase n=1 Tax=Vasconcelosia minhoensis LEGE 07310 TaxID=915328 RepID=A0A8J7DMH2_9CYAN|nr:serine/threonine phosphatase [Romeria gracilis]MBE9076655.1 serine/threonine phosphatase [Romeria aff. gracilis LEGE 07310]
MPVCEHCQFENPSGNKFCQRCGEPLQQWQAWLIPHAADAKLPDLCPGDCLDSVERYQLATPLVFHPTAASAIAIDSQPEQPTLSIAPDSRSDAAAFAAAAPAEIPAAAHPYLFLADRPAVPTLHDAWQQADYTVLLVEDRSHLPRLEAAWPAAPTALKIHWCYTMVELWPALAEWNAQASLTALDNLRVDEDQLCCLQQLMVQAPDGVLPLSALGQLWRSLLNGEGDQPAALALLADKIGAGQLASPEPIRQELVSLAEQLESSTELTETLLTTPMLMALETEDDPFELGEFSEFVREDDGNRAEPDLSTMVLPMKLTHLEDTGQTHVGRQREHNEDTFFIQTEVKKQSNLQGQRLQARCLYVLCDGMGGHAGGEVASQLAVDTLRDYFTAYWQTERGQAGLPDQDCLCEAISQANQAIFDINQAEERTGSDRMGTTLVLLLLQGSQAVVAHVGDSRLYSYSRRLGLQQLTVDHEVGQREIEKGVEPEIAYGRPDAYQLTQALGPRDQKRIIPTVKFLSFTEDMLLLLCSDGLSDHELLENHTRSHLDPLLRSPKDLEAGISELIALANESSGHDNITAIGIRLKLKPDLDQLPPLQ